MSIRICLIHSIAFGSNVQATTNGSGTGAGSGCDQKMGKENDSDSKGSNNKLDFVSKLVPVVNAGFALLHDKR
jgi:hypothetical protein